MGIPLIMQIQASDNGAAALAMMLGYHKRFVTIQEMREHCISSRNGSSPEQICTAAQHYGLRSEIIELPKEQLLSQKLPLLICWKKKYYCILLKAGKKSVTLLDPAKGQYKLTPDKLLSSYRGKVIKLAPDDGFEPGGKYPGTLSMLSERLGGYKKWLAVMGAFSALAVFLNIIALSFRQKMIDQVMSGKDRSMLVFLTAAIIATLVLQIAVSISDTVICARVSRKMAAKSGGDVFKQLFRLPLSYFEKISRGEIMDRLERNESIDKTLLSTLAPKLFNGIALCFYLGLIYTYNALLSTVLIGVYLLICLLMLTVQKYMLMIKRSSIASNESMRSSMLNAINSIDSIKASGSEDRFFRIWNEQMNDVTTADRKSLTLDAVYSMLQTLQNVSSSAIMLIVGAFLIIKGELTMGMLSSIQSVFSNVSSNLSSMFSTTKQLQNMRTGLERINDLKDCETIPEIPLGDTENPDKLKVNVKAEHITYRYNKGDKPVLDDVSLTISRGEMVALVGMSGCGKSTLMKLIAGMYRTQEGSITYDGKARGDIPDTIFYSSVACVDQEVNLFADSVRANLKMWDSTVENYEMILAARDAQIHERIMKNPYGYDSMISDNGRNYSGGEHQRLELARALSAETSLLILDEFTSALDAKTEEKVFKAIRDKGTACLIAAHRFSTVVECDKIIVMDHGRIVEQGTHSELYAAKGLYYKLLSLH